MADDNDKSPLTRRRVLGGMATVGVAGAVGAGTWSRFTDTEKKRVTVSAGTLDLSIDGSNGKVIEVDGPALMNGGTLSDCEDLENVGDITGDAIHVNFGDVSDYENGREEPELDVGDSTGGDPGGSDSGELSQYLKIDATLTCDGTEHPCPWVTKSGSSGGTGSVRLNDVKGFSVEGLDMAPGDTCELCFDITLTEEGMEGVDNANDAMSDSTEFGINITLEQKESSGENVSANSSADGPDQGYDTGAGNDGGNGSNGDDNNHDWPPWDDW